MVTQCENNQSKTAISGFNWKEIQNCQNCSLHCYVEPSLVLSRDFWTYLNWVVLVSGFNSKKSKTGTKIARFMF